MPDPMIGQAIYTWSQQALDPRENNGFTFAAASPSLASEMPWLKQVTQPVIDFCANKSISSEERRNYQPLGRIVDRDRAIIFRKVDAGYDARNRIGRYLIHFLVGTREQLTLSVLLSFESIPWPQYTVKWLSAADLPVDKRIEIPDLTAPVEDVLINTTELNEVGEAQASHAARELISSGSVDLAGLTSNEALAVVFCMPVWADMDAVLIPKWTDHGRTDVLTADIRSHSKPSMLHCRPIFNSELLNKTRNELQGENASELKAAITTWVTEGSQALTIKQKNLIKQLPDDSLKILASTGTRFPSRPGQAEADGLAMDMLRRCAAKNYWRRIHQLLPDSDEAAAQLTESVTTCALVLAICYLNGNGRRIEIRADQAIGEETIADLRSVALDEKVIFDGLAESTRISYAGSGRFLRSLLLCDTADHEWLYRSVLPHAFTDESGPLLNIAALNPDLFVKRLPIPPEWRSAIVASLRERSRSRRLRGSLKKPRMARLSN